MSTTLRMLLPGPAELGELAGDPGPGADEVIQALADLYAYPDPVPARGWVRANMVSTLDGSATDGEGRSGSLGGPADRAVFSALRGLADVVVVGAGTARTEGYKAPRPKPAFAERRRRSGQRPACELALVTRSGDVPADAVTPDSGYVVTCSSAPVQRLRDRLGADRVLVVGQDDVDAAEAVAAVVGVGLRRVLLEGGPTLLGAALAAGSVDELCLTQSALLVAGDGPRVALGPAAHHEATLAHLLHSGDALLGRWLVRPRPTGD